MGLRELDAVAGQAQGRLDEPRPGEAPVLAVQRLEARGNAGHAAGGDSDGVVDELGPEEHVELQQLDLPVLRAEARNGDEAVEVAHKTGRGVEDDRVATTE